MANQNPNQKRNRGGGGQHKCPKCGIQLLPRDRDMCFTCRPERKITVEAHKGRDGWQVLVETYQDGVQADISLMCGIEGNDLEMVIAGHPPFDPAIPGMVIIRVPFSEKEQNFSAHLIGADADVSNCVLPAIKKPAFVPTKPQAGGFLANLLRAARGGTP